MAPGSLMVWTPNSREVLTMRIKPYGKMEDFRCLTARCSPQVLFRLERLFFLLLGRCSPFERLQNHRTR
jgi:hypothetical protein